MVVRNFQFSIDRGGTFTDVFCSIGDKHRVIKLLSEDPENYADAPTEGIRRILEEESGIPHPRSAPVDTSRIQSIRMGTTVATNALLERKGERFALLITKGYRDLMRIGNQSRPKIFDLEIQRPDVLYEQVIEVDERVRLVKGYEDDVVGERVVGISQEELVVERPVDIEAVRASLQQVYDSGIRSIAVVLLHAYTFAKHEQIVRDIATSMGFTQISLSSDIMPMVRMVPRGCTTCVDAYLTPVIQRYLRSFCSGFDAALAKDVKITFMQSDGGLTSMSSFMGNRAILSGPAGGVVGYAMTSYIPSKFPNASHTPPPIMPVIGFDMGGTSTDVSRYAGEFEHVFETTTAGVTIQSPQLDINTVAAGGGSKLFFRNKVFVVGPESVGAHPGPVCYRKGGALAVTDANLLLGRLQTAFFPAIFGHSENEPLDLQATKAEFTKLTADVNAEFASQDMHFTVDEVAYGFIRVANEAMSRPIRNLTTMKGYDVTKHALSCFGGAGPQHCCAIAKSLGIRKIFVHRYSGILSAYGLSLASLVDERQEPCSGKALSDDTFPDLLDRLSALEEASRAALAQQGVPKDMIACQRFVNCRYHGTDTAIMTPLDASASASACLAGFVAMYRREFGFELLDRPVLVDDIRVRCVGQGGHSAHDSHQIHDCVSPPPHARDNVMVYFEGGRVRTPVYMIGDFATTGYAGSLVPGPAMIIQDVATVIVEPGCTAFVSCGGDIEISVDEVNEKKVSTVLDPIYLAIFSHRFMGIAEQMGRTLQRTSISVNIKERLDFSCALFDGEGGLVANAPHLPVHLGAMSEAVRYQVRHWGSDIQEGDVLVSNHPQLAGGSHLPDITVITPVFRDGKIVFFVASRGHHADVGGIAPGSMPPLSKSLIEEGAAITAFKLVRNGEFQEAGISELLHAPGKLPNNYGTRNLSDNLSDLKAQVAANRRGVSLLNELVEEYGLDVVQCYMQHIQSSAEEAVRNMLKEFSQSRNLPVIGSVSAQDFLDDGTPICLKITINRKDGSAVFDFEGTGYEIFGNLNAPPAVTASAVIYCLRCLLSGSVDIPLNQGCLKPIDIRIPENSILNPSAEAAVVGGNVLTSQRVTDVVLRAFEACAASQGCMNNLTFGDASMGYYETIAGGAGAGPTWHGASGVHTHMTNTRITDPEILERRYPVLLRQFSLREGSGGAGMYRGGDGVIRELEFLRPLVVSILSERRAFQPYGMRGGSDAARGMNLLHRAPASPTESRRIVNLGGKNTVSVHKGDRLVILSPGGGGYGPAGISPLPAPSVVAEPMVSGSLSSYTMLQESA